MHRRITGLVIVCAAASLATAGARVVHAEDRASAGLPLFAAESTIELGITGPFGAIIDDAAERNRHPMVLRVGNTSLDVEVRLRGNSRVRVCKFPPLRVYFGDDAAGTVFEGIRSLKLVTHCFDSERGDRHVAKEYAAYRVFDVLAPYAYRTRPVRITYRDTDEKLGAAPVVRSAFFLESQRLFADRIGAERTNVPGLRLGELHRDQAATMYVFQYLIGNTDWSLVTGENDEHCCHNVDLVRREGSLVPIPYDFDLAGIVNPPYAKPDPSLRISRVTIRRYRGYCIEREHLEAAVARTSERHEAIVAELRQIPIAEADEIEDILRYLAPFFRQADDGEKLVSRFEKRCL